MFVYFKSNLHVFFSPFGSIFLTSIFMFFIRIKYMHLGRKTHTLNPSTVINICIEKKIEKSDDPLAMGKKKK